MKAIEAGKIAVVADAALLAALPVDVVVEATGNPEAAAATVIAAIDQGRHSVLATKEAEVLVGPILARRARDAGLVHTPADGDQPSLLVGLIAWARLLGFTVIGAGKSTSARNDAMWDPRTQTVTLAGKVHPAPAYEDAFQLVSGDVAAQLARRRLPGMLDRPIVDDLCEVCIVANHTDLDPDQPELHAPLARSFELPQIFRPSSDGGILHRRGTIDMFRGLRRADELAFAGGVFVTVETPCPAFGAKFANIGIPTTADGRVMLLHNPIHLLGAEAVISALSAVRLRKPTGGSEVRQRFDLVGRAQRDFLPGEMIRLAGESNPGASSNVRHSIDGLEPLLQAAQSMGDGAPLPYYLAVGRRVKHRIAAGSLLRCDQMETDARSVLMRLRYEQDALSAEGCANRGTATFATH
jgi:predicted homoserine dehydrogenase-like protein